MRKQEKTSKKLERINELPRQLQGLPQNCFGGHRTQRLRTYGGSFGSASECVSLSREAMAEWAEANGYTLR